MEDSIQIDSKLTYVWLEITHQCNLRCIHCYGQFGCTKSSTSKGMSTEDWKRVIREIKINGCSKIQFIGGEPLCFSDFYKLITYAYNLGMESIEVFTNGTLIDKRFISLIKKTKAIVRVSLYGHNAQIHDSITGIKGSFKKTDNALKLLKKANIPTTVAVVVMQANQSYVNEIKKYIELIGHRYSGYDIIRPVKGEEGADFRVTDIEILKPRYHTVANFAISEEQYYYNLKWNNCWNGKLAITSDGTAMPCIFARDITLGNVNENSITDIINEALYYWTITKDKVDVCKDCEYRYACHNCRPLAMSFGGNISSKELRCCYDPYEGVWCNIRECSSELNRTQEPSPIDVNKN